MLKIDATLRHVTASTDQIVTLLESENQPLVNIPSFGTAETKAFVVGTVTERQGFRVFVYLRQPERNDAVTIYVSDPAELTAQQYRREEAEAVRFLESMTFVMQDLNFRGLLAVQKEAEMRRVGIFGPLPRGGSIVDLVDPISEEIEVGGPSEIFGGLSAEQQNAFRRAGVLRSAGEPTDPVPPPAMSEVPASTPGTGSYAELAPQPVTPAPATGHETSAPQSARPITSPQMASAEPAGHRVVTGHEIEVQSSAVRTSPQMATAPPQRITSPQMVAQGAGTPAPGTPAPATASDPQMAASSSTPQLIAQGTPVGGAAVITKPPTIQTAPAPAAPKPLLDDEDAESLGRLGRLLGTFALLLVVSMASGCATVRKGEPLPPRLDTQVQIANQHLGAARWPKAIQVLEPVVEEAPYARAALHGLGIAYMNLGHRAEAEVYLRRAVDADEKWSVPKNTLATLLIHDGRCAEAETVLAKVLQDIFYPTPEFAEHNMARALACQGRRPEAIARLETLLVKRPKFCLGYLTLAEMASSEKIAKLTIKACRGFRTACAEDEKIGKLVSPEHSCLCYLRSGLAHARLGDVESARKSFTSCDSDGPYGRECRKSLEMLPR